MQQSQVPEARENADRLVDTTRRRLALWDLPANQIEEIERTLAKRLGAMVRDGQLLLNRADEYCLIDRLPPPPPMPRWQLVASRLTHGAFYVLLFAMPVSGWLIRMARPV